MRLIADFRHPGERQDPYEEKEYSENFDKNIYLTNWIPRSGRGTTGFDSGDQAAGRRKK